jgi:hypothetical protein
MLDDGDCWAIGGMKIGKGTKVLGDNLPQRRFVHHKSTWVELGSNQGRRGGKAATNSLSYDAAHPEE